MKKRYVFVVVVALLIVLIVIAYMFLQCIKKTLYLDSRKANHLVF